MNQCERHAAQEAGYLQWHVIAARLHRRGIRQRRCPECGLWLWPQAEFDKDRVHEPSCSCLTCRVVR